MHLAASSPHYITARAVGTALLADNYQFKPTTESVIFKTVKIKYLLVSSTSLTQHEISFTVQRLTALSLSLSFQLVLVYVVE